MTNPIPDPTKNSLNRNTAEKTIRAIHKVENILEAAMTVWGSSIGWTAALRELTESRELLQSIAKSSGNEVHLGA